MIALPLQGMTAVVTDTDGGIGTAWAIRAAGRFSVATL
jgi:hypothetical protein